MRLKTSLAFACITVVLTPSLASAGTEFLSYEGRNAIHDGQGGEKKVVSGIDFWMTGDPPHKFKVLGSITDVRHETGIFGAIRMSGLDVDIAKAAKDQGGDAVILSEESEQLLGVNGFATSSVSGNVYGSGFHANAFGTFFARQIKNHQAHYVVVKYLSDGSSETSTAPPTPSRVYDLEARKRGDDIHLPEYNDQEMGYPEKAAKADIAGTVTLRCKVIQPSNISDCEFISENPTGYGFGAWAVDHLNGLKATDDNFSPVQVNRTKDFTIYFVPPTPHS